MEVGEVEEAAERRQRNLQRRQNQMETEVTDSPGLERQGSSTNRRSVGGISGLSHAQLAEHYQHCLKLSAENKVSQKNAFNLQLIDWMAQAIGKKSKNASDGGVDINDFQIAAGTLDASTKIYGFRVDVVYNDTFKLASGLTQSSKQKADENLDGSNVEGEEGDGVEGDEGMNTQDGAGKKRKRIKKSATVEKNLKNINIGEMELDVDPLFKKTTSQFDAAGGGGNQFLASLRLRDDTSALMMDSETILETRNAVTPAKKAGCTRVPLISRNLQDFQVCSEQLRDLSFINWTLEEEDRLNKSISASQEGRQEEEEGRMEENAFDAFAVPEPVDDYHGAEGVVDNDMEDLDDLAEVTERVQGHGAAREAPGFTANLQMSTADMLSILTTAPLEYSYFDHGKLGAWAGPKHWKFKPMSKVVQEGEKQKGRKRKEVVQLDYDMYDRNDEDNEELQEVLEKLSLLLTVPKKSVKLVDKTMKGWNRERSTLPEDLHYSGHELVRLKTVDKMVVQAVKKVPEAEVDDVEDYDYDNAADNDGYCPDIDDEQDAYGDAMEDPQQTILGSSMMEGDQEVPSSQVADFAGENLVEAPKMVDKAALQIGYAKTAKKVDMKRIKRVAWSILTQASSEEKENQSGSPEKQLDKEGADHAQKEVEETQFTTLYKTLKQPTKLPKTMSENLSVPLAFIALLHLCNEESLHLIPSQQMEDFKIVQGKGWCN